MSTNPREDRKGTNTQAKFMALYAKERGEVQPTRMGEIENVLSAPVIETKIENNEVKLDGNVISNPRIRKNIDEKRVEIYKKRLKELGLENRIEDSQER